MDLVTHTKLRLKCKIGAGWAANVIAFRSACHVQTTRHTWNVSRILCIFPPWSPSFYAHLSFHRQGATRKKMCLRFCLGNEIGLRSSDFTPPPPITFDFDVFLVIVFRFVCVFWLPLTHAHWPLRLRFIPFHFFGESFSIHPHVGDSITLTILLSSYSNFEQASARCKRHWFSRWNVT